ncbi:MAG: hypothetical protein ACI8S3_000061 [Alphaproteobacteria bacterium]|jgi:hypothetical protein
MRECVNCHEALQTARLSCNACGLSFEGTFYMPRLARLEPGQQQLVEQMVLSAGNLKEVAGTIKVSYPTLRKRVDTLITALRTLREQDDAQIAEFLSAVEAGDMTAESAARLIRELHGQS